MGSRQLGPCLWCGSADVQTIQASVHRDDLPPGPRPQVGCRGCGRMWSHVPLKIRRGEAVETSLGLIKVSPSDVAWLRPIRAFLLGVFAEQRQIDAAQLKEQVGFPHELHDVARLLALLAEDCARRGEPSLADLVLEVPAAREASSGESTALISQNDINELLAEGSDEPQHFDEPGPAPEAA